MRMISWWPKKIGARAWHEMHASGQWNAYLFSLYRVGCASIITYYIYIYIYITRYIVLIYYAHASCKFTCIIFVQPRTFSSMSIVYLIRYRRGQYWYYARNEIPKTWISYNTEHILNNVASCFKMRCFTYIYLFIYIPSI